VSARPRAAARQRQALRVVPGLLLLAMLACTIRPEAIAAVFKEPTATALRPTRTPRPQPAQPAVLPTQPLVLDVVAPPTPAVALPGIQQNLVDVYALANTAVVSILVSAGTDKAEEGSGFLYDSSGHIITNEHVVRTAQSIEVSFSTGDKVAGRLVGSDANSDLAVIVVERVPAGVVALRLGDSDRVQVGQQVVAIGNPFGLRGTMSLGIVSGIGRMLSGSPADQSGAASGTYTMPDIIQTDAAINPGNSGGPLLNLSGEVIGVNKAIYSDSGVNSGVGFAIGANVVRRVATALILTGKYEYPYLGIVGQDEYSMAEREALGIAGQPGVYVVSVLADGPAAAAGLRGGSIRTAFGILQGGGDVITAVEGLPVLQFSDLLSYLAKNTKVGQTVRLTVWRAGTLLQVDVRLTARP
jgi:2-alkenal reductase